MSESTVEQNKRQASIATYQALFRAECTMEYPAVDQYEAGIGVAIDRQLLEGMARTLACPWKRNPPNWQHGRVIYAALRQRLTRLEEPPPEEVPYVLVDIGTAKGFSACVMAQAVADAGWQTSTTVQSADVVDPGACIPRNSVEDLRDGGPPHVYQLTQPHIPPNVHVEFSGTGSAALLARLTKEKRRVPFAFVDGKHTMEAVTVEAQALSKMQRTGDVIVFDDLQLPGVGAAVRAVKGYRLEELDIGPRIYGIAVRQ